MGIDHYYRDAIKVSERLGTWVLYAARDARDLDQLVGYMSYTVDDMETMRLQVKVNGRQTQAKADQKRARISQLVGFWRRAIRWVSSLDREHYQDVAGKLIEQLEAHPEHRSLRYYIKDTGHRTLTPSDRPPRRAGRPRTRPAKPRPLGECPKCRGVGYLER